MKKFLLTIGILFASYTFAQDNNTNDNYSQSQNFQKIQRQYNINYTLLQGQLINGKYDHSWFNAQKFGIELERLFDNNVWLDVDSYMITQYHQPDLGRLNGGGNNLFGQYPFMFGMNAKLGYAYYFMDNKLQLTPYIGLGRNANLSTSTVISNNYNTFDNDYYYTGTLGARLSYLITDNVLLYLDQSYIYNWDNSSAIKHIQSSNENYEKSFAATHYQFNTQLGTKINITNDVQIGAYMFVNNYQVQSNISGRMYTPTNTFGEGISIGFTY